MVERRYRVTIVCVAVGSFILQSWMSVQRASLLRTSATPGLLMGAILLLLTLSAGRRPWWIRAIPFVAGCTLVAWVAYAIGSTVLRPGAHLEYIVWDCLFAGSFGMLLLPLAGWYRTRWCILVLFAASFIVLEYSATKRAAHMREVRDATGVILLH